MQESSAGVVVHSIYLNTHDDLFTSLNKPLTIFADRVDIANTLRGSGQRISIFAREINFAGGTVDVSGSDAPKPSPPQARSAVEADAVKYPESKAGDDGNIADAPPSTANGGTIRLVAEAIFGTGTLRANGGKGAKGQQGGNGAAGATGPSNPGVGGNECHAGSPGGQGGRGGRPGAGSNGGPGGTAGAIDIVVTKPLPGSITLELKGGDGGDEGDAGSKGADGAPGKGGINFQWHYGGARGVDHCAAEGRFPDGPPALPAAPPDRTPIVGAVGKAAAAAVKVSTYQDVAQDWDPAFLTMLMHRIEQDYLNGDYTNCVARAAWLSNITANAQAGSVPATLHGLAETTLLRLRQGQDFYGKPPGYVPLTTLEQINQLILGLLESGEGVERSFASYFTRAAGDAQQVADLNVAFTDAQGQVATAQAELSRLRDERKVMEDQLNGFNAELDRLFDAIPRLQSDFVSEVQQQAGNCTIFDCLIAIASIVSVAAAAVKAIDSISNALKILPPGSHTALPGRLAAIEKVGEGFAGVKTKYAGLKNQLNPSRPRDLDSVKLVMQQKEFDDMLKPFRDIAAAKALQDSVDRYCALTQQRNQRLLDYATSFTTEDSLTEQISLRQANRDDLQTRLSLAALEASESVSAKTFWGGVYLQAKRDICKGLWQKRQILEYAMLSDVDFSVNDMDISLLKAKNQSLKLIEDDYRAEVAQPFQPLPSVVLLIVPTADTARRLEPQLRDKAQLVVGSAFDEFLRGSTGELRFSIPRSSRAFANLGVSSIRLTGVDVRLIGVDVTRDYGERRINVDMIQLGVSEFVSPMKEIRSYVHRPIAGKVIYDLDQPSRSVAQTNLTGISGQFTGVSPFGPWLLRVGKQSRDSTIQPILPVMGGIKAIVLSFSGGFQSFDPLAPNGVPA